MAKVVGALLGRKATGTLGGSVIFQGWKGLTTVRGKVDPANPKTALQTAERTKYGECVECFRDYPLSLVDKAAWDFYNKIKKGQGTYYNRYVKTCIGDKVRGYPFHPLHKMEYLYVNSSSAKVTLYGPEIGYLYFFVGQSPFNMIYNGRCNYDTDHYYIQTGGWVRYAWNYWFLNAVSGPETGIYRQWHDVN
jgi:hypothetical protein